MGAAPPVTGSLRTDIQALGGLAGLPGRLHCARPGLLPAGPAGVSPAVTTYPDSRATQKPPMVNSATSVTSTQVASIR